MTRRILTRQLIESFLRCVLDEEMAEMPAVKRIIFIADSDGEDLMVSSSMDTDDETIALLEKSIKHVREIEEVE